jgi:SPOR domain
MVARSRRKCLKQNEDAPAMAVYSDQRPYRSRRFVKVYLATWALMGVGALAYLVLLALQPHHQAAQTRAQVTEPDPSQAIRALAKTTVEMGTMRRNLTEIQKDVAHLKEAVVEREVNEKAVTARLTAVEERLATLPPPGAEPADSAAPAKAKVSERHQRRAQERTAARAVNVPQESPAHAAPAPSSKDDGPPVPLVTGSIAAKEEITFGEPVVTRAGPSAFAIQLAAGPSLQGLRQSWSQLRERHGALAVLEPRVIPPRSQGGAYRLLAGPFASRADADRVCTELGVGRNGCHVTNYAGTPL